MSSRSPAIRISIALAVRNGARYLGPLLDSLARQTAPPHELVAYDDASDDDTGAILAGFAREAPFRVRVVGDDAWRGHVAGFMHAAGLCEGDAIAFCDGDDVWEPHKLERCGAALERSGTALVLHSTRVVDAELGYLGRDWPAIGATRLAEPLELTGLEIDAPGMAMVFRRDLLEIADFDARPPSRYGLGRQMLHDEWVFFLAGVLGRVALIAEPLVLYRQHGANDSGGWVEHRRDRSLRPATGDYRRAAAHTAACADYLERTTSPDPVMTDRLSAGARAYRQASEQWALRLALYEAPGRRTRARLVRRLIRARAYRARTSGGLGRAALAKDLAAGVALGVGAGEER